ncbi:MAG: zinc-ribbon domain-containing protein [Acidobacteriota bacterium]
MFCPKCGTENPETGKFCRSCGTDLGNVSAALSGELKPSASQTYIDHKGRVKSNNLDDLWSGAIRSIIMGVGFLVISVVLFITGVAGGHIWWWAMLFPAFPLLANGFSQLARAKSVEKKLAQANPVMQNQIPTNSQNLNLPPTQTEFVKPQSSIYDTGELITPPSVTEGTTRHLEINKEGETMTLPKK